MLMYEKLRCRTARIPRKILSRPDPMKRKVVTGQANNRNIRHIRMDLYYFFNPPDSAATCRDATRMQNPDSATAPIIRLFSGVL